MAASKQLVESGSAFAFAEANDAFAKSEIIARANTAQAAAKVQIAKANVNDQALWSAFNQQLAQATMQPATQFGGSPIDANAWPTGAAAVAFRAMSAQALDRINEQAMQFSAAAGGAFWSPINPNAGLGGFNMSSDPSFAYDFVTWQINPNGSTAPTTVTNAPVIDIDE